MVTFDGEKLSDVAYITASAAGSYSATLVSQMTTLTVAGDVRSI